MPSTRPLRAVSHPRPLPPTSPFLRRGPALTLPWPLLPVALADVSYAVYAYVVGASSVLLSLPPVSSSSWSGATASAHGSPSTINIPTHPPSSDGTPAHPPTATNAATLAAAVPPLFLALAFLRASTLGGLMGTRRWRQRGGWVLALTGATLIACVWEVCVGRLSRGREVPGRKRREVEGLFLLVVSALGRGLEGTGSGGRWKGGARFRCEEGSCGTGVVMETKQKSGIATTATAAGDGAAMQTRRKESVVCAWHLCTCSWVWTQFRYWDEADATDRKHRCVRVRKSSRARHHRAPSLTAALLPPSCPPLAATRPVRAPPTSRPRLLAPPHTTRHTSPDLAARRAPRPPTAAAPLHHAHPDRGRRGRRQPPRRRPRHCGKLRRDGQRRDEPHLLRRAGDDALA